MGALGDPDHMLEVHHFDSDFVLVGAEEVLGVIGAVEVLACGVFTGASVVATHDEVCAAVVGTDQAMPDRFTRACHAHRKIEQAH